MYLSRGKEKGQHSVRSPSSQLDFDHEDIIFPMLNPFTIQRSSMSLMLNT